MTDKNGRPLCFGDFVLYERIVGDGKSIFEFGKIFEFTTSGVFLTVRDGCFYCIENSRLQLLTDPGDIMLRMLETP